MRLKVAAPLRCASADADGKAASQAAVVRVPAEVSVRVSGE
jgi:hypothetical protein